MATEPRCDLHGPYTAVEAALSVLGEWQPIPTGYLCPICQDDVSELAQELADRIDADVFEHVSREIYGKAHNR